MSELSSSVTFGGCPLHPEKTRTPHQASMPWRPPESPTALPGHCPLQRPELTVPRRISHLSPTSQPHCGAVCPFILLCLSSWYHLPLRYTSRLLPLECGPWTGRDWARFAWPHVPSTTAAPWPWHLSLRADRRFEGSPSSHFSLALGLLNASFLQ